MRAELPVTHTIQVFAPDRRVRCITDNMVRAKGAKPGTPHNVSRRGELGTTAIYVFVDMTETKKNEDGEEVVLEFGWRAVDVELWSQKNHGDERIILTEVKPKAKPSASPSAA